MQGDEKQLFLFKGMTHQGSMIPGLLPDALLPIYLFENELHLNWWDPVLQPERFQLVTLLYGHWKSNTNSCWLQLAYRLNRLMQYLYIILCMEKAMAPHSGTLAWKIPWTEEPGGLQSMGSLGVRHDWATSLSLSTFMLWRRKWQPTPVFLPGESQGQRSLVGCHLWGCTESDMTYLT